MTSEQHLHLDKSLQGLIMKKWDNTKIESLQELVVPRSFVKQRLPRY